jgi:putative transposase
MKLTKKILIKPNNNQKNTIDFWLRRCGYLYNVGLEEKIAYYKVKGKYLNPYEQKKELVDIKNYDPTWKSIPNKSLTEVIFRLDKAFQAFFKRKYNGFPKFKPINNFNTIYFIREDIKIKNNNLYFPKIKTSIKYNEVLPDKYDSVYLKKENNKYYILFIINVEEIKHNSYNKIVGVDLGLNSLLTTDNGKKINRFSLKLYNNYQKRIKLLNKSLSAKKKNSNRFKKVKKQLNKTHTKLAYTRNDFLHKTSTNFIKENINNKIIVGDIKVNSIIENSYKSKKIYNKKGFRRNFYNASLNEFKKMLLYKSFKFGCSVEFVDERNTSKTCSCCHYLKHNLKLSNRVFTCDNCGTNIDRDVNAAINIKDVWLGQFKSIDLNLCKLIA